MYGRQASGSLAGQLRLLDHDDAHQFGGIGVMAADQNIYGRIYVSGSARGVSYSY